METLIAKPDTWLDVLSAFEVYEKKSFSQTNTKSIRSILSTTIKTKFPERIYKTGTKGNIIFVERLK